MKSYAATAGTVASSCTVFYRPAIAGTVCTISTVFSTKIRFVFSVTFLVTGVGRRSNEQKEDRSVDGQAAVSAQGRTSSDRAKRTSAVRGRLATKKAVGGNPSRRVTWAQVVSGGSNVTATK